MSDSPSNGAVVEALEANVVPSHEAAATQVARAPAADAPAVVAPTPAPEVNGAKAEAPAKKPKAAPRAPRARKAAARTEVPPAEAAAPVTDEAPSNLVSIVEVIQAQREAVSEAAAPTLVSDVATPVDAVATETDAVATADAQSLEAPAPRPSRSRRSAAARNRERAARDDAAPTPEVTTSEAPAAREAVHDDAGWVMAHDLVAPGAEVEAELEAHADDAHEAVHPHQEQHVHADDHGGFHAREVGYPESERRRLREDGELPHDRFDPDAVKVVARLHQHGHQAYFVGGCVRDLILDRPPKDFDVATSATPNEVRGIFRNCRLIGRRFRLAHVYFKGGKVVEVSTFRANPSELEAHGTGNGEDGAEGSDDLLITHDNVFGTADEDARRRDFTMNGLFYDIESGTIIDFVNGRRDLSLREIRTIGDPEVRMREDPVRILRAVRFAAKLGLDIESRTYAAMEGTVEDLSRCAPARLLEETFRLLRGGYAETSLKLLDALDALSVLLPPLGQGIRAGGKAAEARCWCFAAALDKQIKAGAEFDDSVLLAALLVPISTGNYEEDEDGQRQSVGAEVEELLAALVQSARLPRRIAERSRQLLLAQRTLSGERRRRGGQAGFRRHPVFQDALRIFEMTVEATGEHAEALEAWKAGAAPTAAARAPEAEGSTSSKRPRRRRGRRRGGGEGAPAGE